MTWCGVQVWGGAGKPRRTSIVAGEGYHRGMPDNAYQFRIQTEPSYLPEQSDPEQGRYTFAYTITIQNTGQVPAQLISRHWDIEDANGHVETVDGLGVVGKQPLLRPGESFQYSSGAQLRSSMGIMSGHYFFVAVDGTRFEVTIAPFVLKAVQDASQRPPTLH